MTRHKLFESLKECIFSRDIGICQEKLQHIRIEFLDESVLFEDRPDTQAAQKLSVLCHIVVIRFCAELIAQAVDQVILIITDRQGKHAIEMIRHVGSPLLIGSNKYFLFALFCL